ncbi:MAG: hypothetical protein EBU56_08590 [Burkholderiaceae bacterium]|nr:hypothetical protein [Burkholderiaceae bacterium]
MASYFRQVPNFEYVSRIAESKNISDYIQVKNFFKKGSLRPDIFQELAFFEKYQIRGNDRPDNVAEDFYGESTLDWVILLSNNIINIQSEWPLLQDDLDRYLVEKYGDYDILYNGIHHYETSEIKNSQGVTIVPSGFEVSSPYSVSYYDYFIDSQIDTGNIAVPVTNYDYEIKIEDAKRNIYLLKPTYLNIVINDMDNIMPYKRGSTQYLSENLKRGDNIRLYS